MAKFLLLFLMLAASYAVAEGFTNLGTVAKQIRGGKIDVGNEYSMDFGKGRFHEVHVNTLGLDCTSCHYGKEYKDDFLLVRKYEYPHQSMPGLANRQTCIACHQTGGIASKYYIGRAGKE